MRHRSNGFTLIEALVAMSLLGILAGMAVPAARDAYEAGRSGAAKAPLLDAWLTSVTHAAATGSEVVLCPGDASGCRNSTDWSHGWIAFADLDGNRTRGEHEPLLATAGALGGNVHLRSTVGRTRMVFQPHAGSAGTNLTWTLCDGRGPDAASTIVVANNGRLRSGTPTADAALACMAEM
jgi:type IV fimbrial biogenesis protein FimT